MAEEQTPTTTNRPDVDIEQDIIHTMQGYAPLQHDRSRIAMQVTDGAVAFSGHTKTEQAREYLHRETSKIAGVQSVDSKSLYDDESLRIQTGQVTPFGVYTSVSYGAVVLAGRLPAGMTVGELVTKIEKIPGVRKVIPNFPA